MSAEATVTSTIVESAYHLTGVPLSSLAGFFIHRP